MLYAAPGAAGAKVQFKAKYDNFINGKWTPPVKGQYFDNVTPITGKTFCQAARSTEEDINLALDAAHAAADKWGRTSVTDRANALLRIADRIDFRRHGAPAILAVITGWGYTYRRPDGVAVIPIGALAA